MKVNLNPKVTAAILVIILASCIVGAVAAASIIWVPGKNAITGTPLTPNPTASPTASPSPTPTTTVVSATLTANDTDSEGTYIFYKGNTLHITATCNGSGIRDIQLYNNGALITTTPTNAAGVAVFDRVVNNPYNYTVKVAN